MCKIEDKIPHLDFQLTKNLVRGNIILKFLNTVANQNQFYVITDDFNVYKCVNCGAETQDELPNRIEHVKIYFDYQYQIYDLAFNDKAISKKSKQILREEYNLLKAKEKGCIESNDAVLNAREESRKAIYESIAAYKGMYEELLLPKHMFDRDISEA